MLSKYKKTKVTSVSQYSNKFDMKHKITMETDTHIKDKYKTKNNNSSSAYINSMFNSPPFRLPESESTTITFVKEINELLRFSLERQMELNISDNCGFIVHTLHMCLSALGTNYKVVTGTKEVSGKEIPHMWLSGFGHFIDNTYVKGLGKQAIGSLKAKYPKCYKEYTSDRSGVEPKSVDLVNSENRLQLERDAKDFKEAIMSNDSPTAETNAIPENRQFDHPFTTTNTIPSSSYTHDSPQGTTTTPAKQSSSEPPSLGSNKSSTPKTKMGTLALASFLRKRRINVCKSHPNMALALVLNNYYASCYFFAMVRYMFTHHKVSIRGIDPKVRYMCWGCYRYPKEGHPFFSNVTGNLTDDDVTEPEGNGQTSWRFSKCARCGVANYCSAACQDYDWCRNHCVSCLPHESFFEELQSIGDTSQGRF